MGFAHRRRFAVVIFAGVCAAWPNAPARAEPPEVSDGQRCKADALEKWYCAAPRGSAVVDALGRVVCAPGACVKQDTPDPKDEWLCSWEPGGGATPVAGGPPECDGKCRPPEATACKQR